MKRLLLLLALSLIYSNGYAVCSETFQSKYRYDACKADEKAQFDLDQKRKKDKRKTDSLAYDAKLKKERSQYNTGTQSGNSGQVFNFGQGGAGGGDAGANALRPETPLAFTKHEWGFSYNAYIFPETAGVERQQPKQFMINQTNWNYNLSQAFAVGAMFQQFSTGGGEFDPVVENKEVEESVIVIDPETGEEQVVKRTVNKDIITDTPGTTQIDHQRLLYYVQVSGLLGAETDYAWFCRIGSGYMLAKVHKKVYNDKNKVSDTEIVEVNVKRPWLGEFGVSRVLNGTKIGGSVKFVEGDNGESDYMNYFKVSTIEIGVNVTFDIPSLGIL